MNKVPAMHLFISLSRWDSQTQEPLGSEREKVGQLGETRSGSAQSFFFVTFAACGPLGPVTISNCTKSPSDKLRNLSSKIAAYSRKTAGPRSRPRYSYHFVLLNLSTVPVNL